MSVIERAVQGQPITTTRVRRVREVMNPDVMTVADDITTEELVRVLDEREISGASWWSAISIDLSSQRADSPWA